MNNSQPVFAQIIEIIENDIITEVYRTDDMIISTTQISKLYSVNPTTAMRAIGKLSDAGILYKKRGVGMCVAEGAREKIFTRRKQNFLNDTVAAFVKEAKRLDISVNDIIQIIRERENIHD